MKIFLSAIVILWCIPTKAQIPPTIEWQKSLGGTGFEFAKDMVPVSDGGSIMCGMTSSNNGNILGFHGVSDAWVVKFDMSGNIQWAKCYGGSLGENAISIIQTTDGGYIFTGSANSQDGDVSGNHNTGVSDVWVVKIDISGNIQWQRCYGGSRDDQANSIYQTSDGGYIIGSMTVSDDGDITNYHGGSVSGLRPYDSWVIKIDAGGNLQWQKCFGGTKGEWATKVIEASNGGYILVADTWSDDGDIGCTNNQIYNEPGIIWVAKLDNTGTLQWKFCSGSLQGRQVSDVKQTPNGGYIIAGETYGDHSGYGYNDVFVLKIDQSGATQWQKLYGGSNFDAAAKIILTSDGGYVLAGYTFSTNVDVCRNNGDADFWVVKISGNGALEWQKTYGGSAGDYPLSIMATNDGGYIVFGHTNSNDGDVSGNHGIQDWWVMKLAFPGIPVLPSINIQANINTICPGQSVTFSSEITNGGTAPSYQWTINGIIAADDNAIISINTLNNGDSVSCILISNSPCVTSPTDTSNIIAITVDSSLVPANFLPADESICSYSTVSIKPSGNFKTYLWSTNDITPTLEISQTGIYWLQVTNIRDCQGRDTIFITSKDCPEGFFMPTAFTPNNDGKNDILKPTLGGIIKQYKLIIANRWGQIVFQTSDREKGWDGTLRGVKQNSDVYVWTCTYQFEGEEVKFAKGTVAIIK